jgi:hypothetical protein
VKKEDAVIRAKFRCMSVTHRWDGERIVEMLPVTHRQPHTTEGEVDAEENLAFWKATPSGRIELHYRKDQGYTFEPGAYYYVDLDRSEVGIWKLDSFHQWGESIEVIFHTGWGGDTIQRGEFKMSIDNEDAWGHFTNQVGTKWRVAFTEVQNG